MSPALTIGPVVLVTWPDYDPAEADPEGTLAAAGARLRLAAKLGARSTAELLELTEGVAAAIVSTDPFDAGVIARRPELRVIARVGVGVDTIDLAAATAAGVAVTVTPGANAGAVAEHTVALMLAAIRRVPEHDAAVRRGAWRRTGPALPGELGGRTVGLIGYGETGRRVAELLVPFGVRVLFDDPVVGDDALARRVSLSILLREADVVSLHVPLLPATRGMIGPAELERLRPGAILVNTARGGLVDEPALLRALEGGRLRAAALDVFATEPPASARLLELPNVVLTPHVAGLGERSVRDMTRRATRSVIDVLEGRVPRDLANPAIAEAAA